MLVLEVVALSPVVSYVGQDTQTGDTVTTASSSMTRPLAKCHVDTNIVR